MKYICLDTNIYLDAIFDRHQNQYSEIINAIIELLDNNIIRIILPETIEMEFLRHYKEEVSTIRRNINEVKKYVEDMAYPIELREYREKTINSLNDMNCNFKEKGYSFDTTKIHKIFNHENTTKIKLSENILLSSYKRSFLKRKPNYDNFLSGDNSIVESLIYFSKEKRNKIEIDFLTRNYKDFGSNKNNKDKIHEDLAEEFKENNINYVYDILEYLHKLDKVKNINTLPETDKREYFVICPRCKYMGQSEWINECPKCGYIWVED